MLTRRIPFIITIAAAIGSLLAISHPASAADKPNIIVIMADDMGYGDLSCYGATEFETPNIDRLAKEGQRFTSGYCSASTCTPTRYSLLTGTYPPRHGVRNNLTHHLRDDIPTLAEWLSTAGYRTAAYVSAAVLERRYGLDQGFEIYDDEIRSSAGR